MRFYICVLALYLVGGARGDTIACSSSTRPRVMTSASGSFSSPNYPSNYVNSANCQWRIDPPGNAPVILEFDDFGTESGYDFVEVYDGPSASSTRVLRASGTTVPSPITSSGGTLFVRFTSDSSVTAKGFSARYSRPDPACSGSGEPSVIDVALGETGTLTSPGHPEDYPPNLDCGWTLRAPSNGAIELEFPVFVVEEEDLNGCRWDYLEILEPVDNSRSRHCGNDTPPARTSLGRELSVFFISDQSIQRIGFTAQYRAVDRSTVTDPPSQGTTLGTDSSTLPTLPGGSTYPTAPPTVPTIPPNITLDLPNIRFYLNGTFLSVGQEPLNPSCVSLYSEEIRKSFVRYALGANELIGDSLCSGLEEMVIIDGETSTFGFNNQGFTQVRVTQETVGGRTWDDQIACGLEVATHARNISNWQSPIIPPLTGCPAVEFAPLRFDIEKREFECLYSFP